MKKVKHTRAFRRSAGPSALLGAFDLEGPMQVVLGVAQVLHNGPIGSRFVQLYHPSVQDFLRLWTDHRCEQMNNISKMHSNPINVKDCLQNNVHQICDHRTHVCKRGVHRPSGPHGDTLSCSPR